MRRARWGCWAALALAACDGGRTAELPGELSWIASVEPTARSPLLPVERGAALVAREPAAAALYGYRADQLGGAVEVDPDEPLSLARAGCGLLPAPAWSAAWEGGDAPAPPPLQARWMAAGCPQPEQVHLSCRNFRVCSGAPSALAEPCAWSVGCSDASVVHLHTGAWPLAPGCAVEQASAGPATPLSVGAWSHDRREFRGIAELAGHRCAVTASRETPAPVEVPPADSLRVWTGTPRLPGTLTGEASPFLDVRAFNQGGIHAAFLDRPRRRLIMAVTESVSCPTDRPGARGAWRSVDVDAVRLSTTTLARAPACLTGVRRLGDEDGPLAVVGFTVDKATGWLTVHRFGPNLGVQRRRTIVHLLPSSFVADVQITADRWLVLSTQVTGDIPSAQIHVIDPVSLTVTATLGGGVGSAFALELGATGTPIAYLRDRTNACHFEGAAPRCGAYCGSEVFAPLASVIKLTSLVRDPADGAPVLAATDAFHGVFACGRQLWLQPPTGDAQVVTLSPLGPGRMVAAVVGRWGGLDWRGRLMIADLNAGGFERDTWALPGTVTTAIVPDGERLWLVMPWDGLIVRWTPPR